eukprot:g4056.t1
MKHSISVQTENITSTDRTVQMPDDLWLLSKGAYRAGTFRKDVDNYIHGGQTFMKFVRKSTSVVTSMVQARKGDSSSLEVNYNTHNASTKHLFEGMVCILFFSMPKHNLVITAHEIPHFQKRKVTQVTQQYHLRVWNIKSVTSNALENVRKVLICKDKPTAICSSPSNDRLIFVGTENGVCYLFDLYGTAFFVEESVEFHEPVYICDSILRDHNSKRIMSVSNAIISLCSINIDTYQFGKPLQVHNECGRVVYLTKQNMISVKSVEFALTSQKKYFKDGCVLQGNYSMSHLQSLDLNSIVFDGLFSLTTLSPMANNYIAICGTSGIFFRLSLGESKSSTGGQENKFDYLADTSILDMDTPTVSFAKTKISFAFIAQNHKEPSIFLLASKDGYISLYHYQEVTPLHRYFPSCLSGFDQMEVDLESDLNLEDQVMRQYSADQVKIIGVEWFQNSSTMFVAVDSHCSVYLFDTSISSDVPVMTKSCDCGSKPVGFVIDAVSESLMTVSIVDSNCQVTKCPLDIDSKNFEGLV